MWSSRKTSVEKHMNSSMPVMGKARTAMRYGIDEKSQKAYRKLSVMETIFAERMPGITPGILTI